MSGEFRAMLSEHGVQHAPSSAYHPQSQRQAERLNQTFKRLLYAYMTRNNTKFWVRALPALLRNYNSSVHSTTGCTPDELHRTDLNEQTRTEVHARLQRAANRSVERSAKKGRRSLQSGSSA